MNPVAIARSQLGVRWRHHGRKPGKYLDCVGLLVVAFREYGLADVRGYGRDPFAGLLEAHLAAQFGPAIDGPMQPGDVVAIAFPSVIRHVGILGDYPHGGLSLIHTDSMVQCVTEHRLDERHAASIKRVYRMEKAG